MLSEGKRLTTASLLPTTRSPRIRTPSPSRSNGAHSPPRSSWSKLPMATFRLISVPRSIVRVIVFILALIVILLFISDRGDSDGTWDASTYGERSRVRGPFGFGSSIRERFSWSDLAQHAAVAPEPRRKGTAPRPNLSRLEGTMASNRSRPHRGYSRVPIEGTDDEFIIRALPSLDEAFGHLKPLLWDIKERTPSVPREHDLGNPLFPPFLTDDLQKRYAHLTEEWDERAGDWVEGGEKRYLMVTICRQVAGMLADWFSAWTVLADYLGPETLVFSLMEGDSDDGSGEILAGAMRKHLLFIGVPPENIFISTHLPKIDWEASHRIELLADMRNAVMKPIFASPTPHLSPDGYRWTAIVFYNDVYLSATHYLELLHQQFWQDADMTCGWDHAGKWFYDGWVGRDMSGDLYTPFPVPEEDQDKEQKLFPSSPITRERHIRSLPYQVFSGWNGIAVMSPTPFLPPYNVRFRRGIPRLPEQHEGEEECQASESAFISWDFWRYGFGRIQTVPGVHLTYGKDDARLRGWVEFPRTDEGMDERIDWEDEPPNKVRCHDWPDKPGKGWWAWDTVRWVSPPKLEIPAGAAGGQRKKKQKQS